MGKTIYRKPGVLEISKGWALNYKVFQYFEEYTLIFSLVYLTFYIRVYNKGNPPKDCDRSWGICYHDNALWFNWGDSVSCIRMPWDWKHVRHQVMFAGPEMKYPKGNSWDIEDGRVVFQYPYKYRLNSGEVQHRMATIYVEEREWRWRGLSFLPYPRKIRKSISVEFNGEVGEDTGSWKGGVTGCGYEMLPNETAIDTIKRMEKVRRF